MHFQKIMKNLLLYINIQKHVLHNRFNNHWEVLKKIIRRLCSNATFVVQTATTSRSRAQQATDNGVRDGGSS